MNVLAFVLALAAIVCLLVEALRSRPVGIGWLGLALFVAVWVVAVVVTSGTLVSVH